MTTISTVALKCPQCDEKIFTYELMSTYIHRSDTFTDGKVICYPNAIFDNRILICPACNKPFWKDEALLEDDRSETTDPNLPQAIEVWDLLLELEPKANKLSKFYLDLLDDGFANSIEKEIYIRTKLWQSLNDKKRYKSQRPLPFSSVRGIKDLLDWFSSTPNKPLKTSEDKDIFNNNLKRLISIYIPENDNELLLQAEMYREIGDFIKASELLNDINAHEKNNLYKEIRKAVKRKRTDVFKIQNK